MRLLGSLSLPLRVIVVFLITSSSVTGTCRPPTCREESRSPRLRLLKNQPNEEQTNLYTSAPRSIRNKGHVEYPVHRHGHKFCSRLSRDCSECLLHEKIRRESEYQINANSH